MTSLAHRIMAVSHPWGKVSCRASDKVLERARVLSKVLRGMEPLPVALRRVFTWHRDWREDWWSPVHGRVKLFDALDDLSWRHDRPFMTEELL